MNAFAVRTTNVRMTRYVILLPFIVACSSAGPQAGDDSGAPLADAAAGDSAHLDAASTTDSGGGGDAGLDPLVPHPPQGSTKCGSGVITSGSAQAVCTEPSFILDDAPLPDGGMGAMPRACNALTINSGEWQVWCTATDAYVWARIPVTNANVLQDCHGASLLMIDYGLYESGSGGGNGLQALTYESDGTAIAGTPPNDPQTIIASITLPSVNGSAKLWVAGSLEDTCNGGGFGPPTVLMGLEAIWTQ